MDREFVPIPTAEGWQLSNAPVLSMAAHKASLDIFAEAGMGKLLRKSREMNTLMIAVIREINDVLGKTFIRNITPDEARGCQTSLLLEHHARDIFNALTGHGILADWREPNVIRVAPVPLYNTFTDIHNFGKILLHLCQAVN
jgi:kynureninase